MEDNKTRSLFTQEITSMPEKENQIRCMGCMEEFSADFGLCPNCGYIIGTAPKLKSYLRPGTVLSGNYMLGRVIGQGGFGITYIAWDENRKRKVAVKEFFPSALSTREEGETHIICYNGKAEQYFKEGVKKMLDEGNRLSKYSSNPNIVNVYDYFEENGTAYIAMEYLEGRSLKEYAEEKGGKLDPREAVNLMMPVISALEEMHKENMIHRDIAPDNIYICDDGKIKLLDFGSARIAVQDAEKSLSVMVKPGYAPKEQYASRSKQGPWTDIYSVCATIYKLVTGESPVESIEREVTPLKTFAEFGITGEEKLEYVLFKGLEPEPANRIRSATALRKILISNVLDENKKKAKKQFEVKIEDDEAEYEIVNTQIPKTACEKAPKNMFGYEVLGIISLMSVLCCCVFNERTLNIMGIYMPLMYNYFVCFLFFISLLLFNVSSYKLRKFIADVTQNKRIGIYTIIFSVIAIVVFALRVIFTFF